MVPTAAAREDFRQMIGPSLAQAAAELSRIPDPGVRETGACALLPDALLELPEAFLDDALDIVAGTDDGPELLAGLAVAAPTPIALRARARLEQRESRSAGLGRLHVERAWEMEADEPVSGLFLLASREGASGRQLFSFTVETPVSGGAVKDGFVTGTSEGTRVAKRLTGELPEEVAVRELEPSEARQRVVAAAVQGARTGLSPGADGLVALTVFLRASGVDDADAIVQALELGTSLPERIDELEDQARAESVTTLAHEARAWFLDSGVESERADDWMFACGLMGDFRAFFLDAELWDWEPSELDAFLLDWVPSKVALEDEEIATFPESVAAVFRFLGATGRLSPAEAADLADRARSLQAQFTEAMVDPASAGPARLLFDAMRADGVEVGDPEAMQAWLEDFNARPFEERDRVLGSALPLPARAPERPPKARKRKAERAARKRNRKR